MRAANRISLNSPIGGCTKAPAPLCNFFEPNKCSVFGISENHHPSDPRPVVPINFMPLPNNMLQLALPSPNITRHLHVLVLATVWPRN